jgi:hypothetical protein
VDGIDKQLNTFQLLVAPRKGEYEPAPELRNRVQTLTTRAGCDEIFVYESSPPHR